ncbi:hypothetical protein WJX72_007188 [[Myrmecia] bisecta]|uniref:Uncharacterized protein n=1 Tax=[Myrmecia] bisecta TaxID=41462 RepID=A0AAW1PFZ6_9CHLO
MQGAGVQQIERRLLNIATEAAKAKGSAAKLPVESLELLTVELIDLGELLKSALAEPEEAEAAVSALSRSTSWP